MAERKCGNCKYYEPAPLFRKGWCRNPRLFSAGQNHLIGAEDLDCDRGIGSYWEAPDDEGADADPLARFTKPAGRTIAPAPPQAGRTPRRTPPPPPIIVRRGDDEEPTERPTTRRTAAPKPAPVAIPEGYEAAHEPYSWGTYLRRSYPAIGVILLLGAVWIWSARLLSGGPPVTPTVPLVAPAVAATVIAVPVITPTAAGAVAPAASTLPAAVPGTIGPGASIIIQTPGGTGANIRQTPAAGGTLVTALNDGTTLTITGASQDADGYTWWPVTGDGVSGWVAGTLIAPAP